jgi:hypothetical protein
LKFFSKQLSKRCHVGISQTVMFMIIRLVTLSVNIFLMSGFLLNFDIDNCLLKKFHYTYLLDLKIWGLKKYSFDLIYFNY